MANSPSKPIMSIRQGMEAMLGGPDVVEEVLACYSSIPKQAYFTYRCRDIGEFQKALVKGRRELRLRGFVQCPHSGKIWYERDLPSSVGGGCDYMYYSLIFLEMVRIEYKTYHQYEMNKLIDILDEGNEKAIDQRWAWKAKEMMEKNQAEVDRATYYTKNRRVLAELLSKMGTPREVNNHRDIMEVRQVLTFYRQPNGRYQVCRVNENPWEVHSDMADCYSSSVVLNESGEQEYANINFYHPYFSSLWSCTVWNDL